MDAVRKRSLEDKPQEAEPKRKKSRKHKPGFDEEIFNETSYYIRNGLRYVLPYYFSFTSHAKGRWVGSRVYDVFCREFQAEKPEFYEKAIQAGKVTVNSEVVTMETVLQHNDLLVHRVHRHEPPVTAQPLTILHQDTNTVAINKPPSIPVHPCGRYRHNSVVFLLAKEYNLRNLHTIHRLDRLTSGLLLFARTLETAQRIEQQIRDRKVTKEYVCKVHGTFPNEPVECTEPILVVSHKLGICRVDPAGKTCSTSFTRLSCDGHTSVLKCVPKTGRMHQIRVHLQWLGYPIVNDPLYGHPAWGPQRGKRGEGVGSMEQVISEIVESNYNSESAVTTTTSGLCDTEPHTCAHTSVEGGRDGREEQERQSVHMAELIGQQDKPGQLGAKDDINPSVCRLSEVDSVVRDDEKSVSLLRETVSGCSVEGSAEEEGERVACDHLLPANEQEDKEVSRTEKSVCADEEQVTHLQSEVPPITATPKTASDSLCEMGGGHGAEGNVCDPDCTECSLVHPDPTPDQLMMYLHALRYTGPDWEYCTRLPSWASSAENEQLQRFDND